MRKIYLVLIVLSFLLLSACSNKGYDEAMVKGEKAIVDGDYQLALSYFYEANTKKEDDEEALNYIKGLEKMIKAIDLYEDGDLDIASSYFEEINGNEKLERLHLEVETYDRKIESLQKDKKDLHTTIEEIEIMIAEEDYEAAGQMSSKLKEQSFSHPVFQQEKKKLEDLDQKLSSLIETQKAFDQILSDIQALEESGKYEEALKAISSFKESSAQKEQFHAKFTQVNDLESSLRAKLEQKKERERAEKQKQEDAKKAKELEGKKDAMINAVIGYWDNLDEAYNYCTFTRQYYICVTEASDVFDYGEIDRWDANVESNIVSMHLEGGYEAKLQVADERLVLGSGRYVKISKEQLAKQLQFTEVDDLFNIEMYRSFSHSYDSAGE